MLLRIDDIEIFIEVFFYDTNAKKITGEIEEITNYRERKKDLERRINILEKVRFYIRIQTRT